MTNPSPKILSPSYGLLFFWIFVCLIGLIASTVLFLKIKNVNENIASTQEQISFTLDQIGRRKGELDFAASIKPAENLIMSTIIDRDDIDSFTKYFDNLAVYAGVKVEIANIMIPVQVVDDGSPLDTVNVSVTIQGNWQQVMHAVALVEAMPYAGKIDTITVHSSEEKVLVGKVEKTVESWKVTLIYKALITKEKADTSTAAAAQTQ